MQIAERSQGDWKVLQLSGRIDNPGALLLKEKLLPLVVIKHQPVVLDLSAVNYLSSAGLRVLLIAAQQSKTAKGHLHVCHVRPTIRDFFTMSGLDKVLLIFPSLSEATR